MTLTSFDDSLLDDGKYRTGGIGQWVAGFPKQYKLLIFDGVKGLNQCLPFNQGVRSDHRFSPQKVRKCSNPEANCPARTSVLSCRKFYSMDPGQIFNGVLLCSACYMYRHKYHKHRPQSVIDKQIRRYQDEDGVCYWCFRQFPPSGYDRKLLVPQLDKFLCQVCYNFWKDNDKAMPPIPGVNVAVDHTFACENASCTRTDRSLAFKWFFDTDNVHTTLTCETCHYDILSRSSRSVYAARNSRRSVQNIIANPVGRDGFLVYCRINFGFEFPAASNERIQTPHNIRNGIQTINYDVRDEWFQESALPRYKLTKENDWAVPAEEEEEGERDLNFGVGYVSDSDGDDRDAKDIARQQVVFTSAASVSTQAVMPLSPSPAVDLPSRPKRKAASLALGAYAVEHLSNDEDEDDYGSTCESGSRPSRKRRC
ncbi:hypothetical protein H2198_007597 [Neophaeococcomyces mojaviensis]|uniref:Uncharacterized protein n=1 Tax=Neophaeococcomyces mojaviensis TaxID=3383035 RepID=A0ACC2ZZH9_9EURO|nr:hypothetical protein H2198_007597 [Knufia sp. JES_112]